MKKFFAFVIVTALSGCSIVNFEFATSQDKQDCLNQNPSNSCATIKK